MVLALVFVLNLFISIVNAVGCGKTWNESRAAGGLPHFLNWMAATMAAVGFTWCYLLIVGVVGASVPVEHDDGTTAPYLDMAQVQALYDLGYLIIIGPLLGSGTVILLNSWRVTWERRTIADCGISVYNTMAHAHNIYSAVSHVPGTYRSVAGFFDSKEKNGKGAVLVLVVLAAFAGIVTTYLIIHAVARSTSKYRSLRLQMLESTK
jgi:hypothetical protein